MKIRAAFNVYKKQLSTINELIPRSKGSHTIRKFILEKYILPTTKDELESLLKEPQTEGETVVTNYFFNEITALRFDEIMATLNNHVSKHDINKSLSKSDVMRDVLDQLIQHIKKNPLEPTVVINRLYRVPKGTFDILNIHIDGRERTAFIEDYILNDYHGPKKSAVELKKRSPEGTEAMYIELAEECFNILDKYVEEIGEKVKQSAIFRDVLEQMIESFEINSPSLQKLEQQLKNTVNSLSKIKTPDEIKLQVQSTLKKN